MDIFAEIPTLKSLSDSELVQRLSEGNNAAAEEIYLRYWPLLFKHATRLLQDEQAAEDVVHDLFAYLLANMGSLGIKGPLDAYLYCAIRNRVLNVLRKHKNSQRYIDSLKDFANKGEATTDDLILQRELKRRIEDAVASMPTKMREAWELSRKENLTRKQIAEITKTTEGTVNTQLNRATKILRAKLTLLFSLF